MRIIAGTHSGMNIKASRNLPVRPTTDRAKESLFNILANYYDFDSISVLDLFSGTGNISFEMASRGCRSIVSVDKNRHCVHFIQKETERLNFQDHIRVVQSDAVSFLSRVSDKFDLIFADPPYDYDNHESLVNVIFNLNLLAEKGRFILEHSIKSDIRAGIEPDDKRKYGQSMFSIYKK